MADPAPIFLDDALWEHLLELTGGAAAPCYQCGTCTATCPWGLVRSDSISVRSLIRQAQVCAPGGVPASVLEGKANLWLCTTCAQCEADCPRGVDITAVMRGLRTLAWEQRQVEPGLPSLLWSEYWNKNPWSQPPSQRAEWSKGMDLPDFDPARHEILLYIGCTSSYDRRAQKIAHALVRLLDAAGVSYGYLGAQEPCCGEAVLSVGHRPYFEEIAAETTEMLHQYGVKRLVTISPHCYDVFRKHYPATGLQSQVQHYTQVLAEMITGGRLNLSHPVAARVTFQDPCYLGRHNTEYEAPRRVLEAIPGLELVEMAANREAGLCCGGGGGRMWLETPPGERFADLRARQAAETGAGILATACPFCLVCLEDSARQLPPRFSPPDSGLQVLDIAEIAALSLEDRK